MSSSSEMYDVVIVGASIAGNYLAYLLSNLPIKVLVLEEHDNIGLPLQCAGIISKKLNKLIELPPHLILNRVKVAKLVSPSGLEIKLSGEEEPYIIDRIGLDKLFYSKIRECENITYLLGEKFKSFQYIFENNSKFLLIKTSSFLFKTKLLVGCDGPVSSVAKGLNVKNDLLYASQVRIKADFPENEAVMYFHPYWKELFGWVVPEGDNIYRIGIASKSNTSKAFQLFMQLIGINPKAAIERLGGLIPYGMMNECAFDHVILLGDSACQVKVTTGGGIVMLLIAAKLAAACIKKCFRANKFSKRFIKKCYQKPVKNTIGIQLKIHYIIRKILETLTIKEFDALFQIIKTSQMERIISLYGDMDFPKDLAYKLSKNFLFLKFILKFGFKHPRFMIKILKIYCFS